MLDKQDKQDLDPISIEEVLVEFQQLKSAKQHLQRVMEQINYYFRDNDVESPPKRNNPEQIFVSYPPRVTDRPRVILENAASMFAKQMFPLDEKSVSINFDSQKEKYNEEQLRLVNMIAKDFTELIRTRLKDKRTKFFQRMRQLANSFLGEGTAAIACYIDQARAEFVLEALDPKGLYFAEAMRDEPSVIFYEVIRSGLNIAKEFGIQGLEPSERYTLLYYFRPSNYDFPDLPDMGEDSTWKATVILKDRNVKIDNASFDSRPVFIARLGRFGSTQYGSGNAIACLDSAISLNRNFLLCQQHGLHSVFPARVFNSGLEYTNNRTGRGLSFEAGSASFIRLAEKNMDLKGGVPDFQHLIPATIDINGIVALSQRAELEISQAFGFASLEEGMMPKSEAPTATQVNREAFVTSAIFEQKAEIIYNEIAEGLIRRIVETIKLTKGYEYFINKYQTQIVAIKLDMNDYLIEFFSSATEQGNLIERQKIQEYITNVAQLGMNDKITPELIDALGDTLGIGKYGG